MTFCLAERSLLAGQQVHGVAVHHFQRLAAATSHAGQRVFGNDHRQAGFLGQQLVEVTQQGATTGQHQATLGDVGGQLRRRLLQGAFHRLNDGRQGFLQRFQHFVGVQGEGTWDAFGQITAAHVDFTHFAAWVGRADFLLDALGGGFADQRTVVTAHVSDDGFVETVATHADGFGVDHTVQRDQGDFSGPTTDIHNHRAASFFNRQAGTDGGSHRLFDQEHFASTGTEGRLTNGTTLNLSRFARHADQYARRRLQEAVFVNLVDEVLQHLLADAEVGDHAVFHRTDGGDVARRTTEHALGLGTHGHHAFLVVGAGTNRHYGRFVEHNAALAHVNQGIGSTQVDRKIAGKHATQFLEHGIGTLSNALV